MYKLLLGLLVICNASTVMAQNSDPTRPLSGYTATGSAEKKVDKLILTAIIHGELQLAAVINGKSLRIGESIGEYELITINNHTVLVRSPHESIKLPLFSNVIVKSK